MTSEAVFSSPKAKQQQRGDNHHVGGGRNAQRAKAPESLPLSRLPNTMPSPISIMMASSSLRKTGDVDHKRLNEAEPREHPGVAKHGGGKNQPGFWFFRNWNCSVSLISDCRGCPAPRSEPRGSPAHRTRQSGKGITPAELVPEPGAERNAHQVGDGHTGDHPATATVTFPGGAILDRIIAPTPKIAPCGKPEISRPSASQKYDVKT
jgi:hypothetical protein